MIRLVQLFSALLVLLIPKYHSKPFYYIYIFSGCERRERGKCWRVREGKEGRWGVARVEREERERGRRGQREVTNTFVMLFWADDTLKYALIYNPGI